MDETLAPSSGILVRSRLYRDQPGLVRLLLLPMLKLKQVFDAAFHWIVDEVSGELRGRKFQRDKIEQRVWEFAVIGFAVLAFLAKDHLDAVTLCLIAAWRAEDWLTEREFASGENHEEVLLRERKDGLLEWKMTGSAAEATVLAPRQVSELRLSRVHLQGGTTRERVATAWRLCLLSDSGTELPLREDSSAAAALAAARKLGLRLKVPVKVAGSQGLGPLAERVQPQMPIGQKEVETQVAEEVSLRAGWTPRSLFRYARHVTAESGFLLFVILVSRVLTCMGAVITTVYRPLLSSDPAALAGIDMRVIPGYLSPFESWPDVAGFALGLAVLLHTGWRLGRPKRLALGERTRFYVGEEFFGSLVTQRLEPPLFIPQPDPLILLTDGVSVIEVKELPSPAAFAALMHSLEARLPQ